MNRRRWARRVAIEHPPAICKSSSGARSDGRPRRHKTERTEDLHVNLISDHPPKPLSILSKGWNNPNGIDQVILRAADIDWAHICRLRSRIPATSSAVTASSLSVSTYVGAPTKQCRVMSKAANTVGQSCMGTL